MTKESVPDIQKVIEEFESFYFRETLQRRINGNNSSVNFGDFISRQEYNTTREYLESQIPAKFNSLEHLIFSNLSEEQKKRIGGLFHTGVHEFSDDKSIMHKADIIDKHVTNTKEYQGYLDVKDFLKQEEKERLATRLSTLLYEQLDDDTKQLIDESSIRKYLLNIGFIRTKRVSHRKAIDFIKDYSVLFRNEEHVLSSILERYIDEELTNTPVKDTFERIDSLRKEVNELYRSILQ